MKKTKQFGIKVGANLSMFSASINSSISMKANHKDDLRKLDVGLVAGVNVYKGFNLGSRYNLSVLPVFKEPDGPLQDYPKISNRLLHLC